MESLGYDTIHTLDLPEKNATSDSIINDISLKEKRIVISKDQDFYDRYFNRLEPHKLLYLTTGNIPNKKLLKIFEINIEKIAKALETNFVVELSRNNIIVVD
ncbi:MAG: DUF5615 family PIN-like protein [Bacteroidota bacterium]